MAVLWAAVAAVPPAPAQEAESLDRVHVLDGPPYEGRVHHFGSDAASNRYLMLETRGGDFVTLRRDKLAAIEFKAGEARELPENPDAASDLIVRRDGSTLSQDVTIIVRDHVVVEGAMLDRATVETIVFRPVVAVAEPDAVQPCPRDRRLGGWVELVFDRIQPGACKRRVTALAWFPMTHWNFMVQSRPPWPLVLEHLQARGLSYEIRLGECIDLPGDEEACSGRSVELASSAPLGGGGIETIAASGSLHFQPLHPELWISFPRDAGVMGRYKCVNRSSGSKSSGADGVRLSKIIIGPGMSDWIKEAPVLEVHAGREPAPCAPGNPDRPSDCVTRPDRHAIIPFSGKATLVADNLYVPEAELNYEVCCGCGEKPVWHDASPGHQDEIQIE